MDKTQKIIIICLIGIIAALGGAIALNLMQEPTKTVELFNNGTTVEVPESTTLKSHDEFSTTYVTAKNTTIIGVDNNNLVGALASKILSEIITGKGEMQDNGLYKLDKKSIAELADQLGEGYDENALNDVYIGIKNNNTVNQTVIVIGIDEKEMTNILESIHWKKGDITKTATKTEAESSSETEKTYPFYADDGTIAGYYHVGDVVEHYDGLYQLKSNGDWVYIGEARSSTSNDQSYSDNSDDTYSDEYDDTEYYDDEYYDYDDYE